MRDIAMRIGTRRKFELKKEGEFVYAVTAAEGIILSSLFIGRKQR